MKKNLMKKYKYEVMLSNIAKYALLAGLFLKYIYSGFLAAKLAEYKTKIDISPVVLWSIVIIIAIICFFLIFFYLKKRRLALDKSEIPRYGLASKLHPSLVGTVIEGDFNDSDFDAGITDLIMNGLLVVEEKEIDGQLVSIWRKIPRNNQNIGRLDDYPLRKFFHERLFQMGSNEYGDGDNQPSFTEKEEQQGWFIYNNRIAHIGHVYEDIESDIKNTKYFKESNLFIKIKVLLGIILITAGTFIIGINMSGVEASNLNLIDLSFVALITITIGIFLFRQRNKEGYKLAHYLKGYYDFLETTELYKLGESETKSDFEKHFPYAVAFGLADMFDGGFIGKRAYATESDLSLSDEEVKNSIKAAKKKKRREDKLAYIFIMGIVLLAFGNLLYLVLKEGM